MPRQYYISEYQNINLQNLSIVKAITCDGCKLNETSHTFTENDIFTFTTSDEFGNSVGETITITNIDKVAPIFGFTTYNSTTPTNQNIIISVILGINELPEGKNFNETSHTFTENDSLTYTATDLAGKTASKTVVIENIDKSSPTATITYT